MSQITNNSKLETYFYLFFDENIQVSTAIDFHRLSNKHLNSSYFHFP